VVEVVLQVGFDHSGSDGDDVDATAIRVGVEVEVRPW
jgi:hypothetical protein